MKITAEDLKGMKIVEEVISEEDSLKVDSMELVAVKLREGILDFIKRYTVKTKDEIATERYNRFRNM